MVWFVGVVKDGTFFRIAVAGRRGIRPCRNKISWKVNGSGYITHQIIRCASYSYTVHVTRYASPKLKLVMAVGRRQADRLQYRDRRRRRRHATRDTLTPNKADRAEENKNKKKARSAQRQDAEEVSMP
eukprot:scaffold49975_cov27-Tisochrysis_lutea.AAC.2